MPSPLLQRTCLLFATWYGLKRAAKWATWDTSRLPPERSTLSPAAPSFQLNCATLMPQRLIACGSTFSRDSQRWIKRKTSRPVATCWITRNLLTPMQTCRPPSAKAAKSLGLATTDLPSLAGQDAQEIARIAPMAMIFVPSKDGISHSPKEFTSWQDVSNGTEVLYRSILLLDGQLDRK